VVRLKVLGSQFFPLIRIKAKQFSCLASCHRLPMIRRKTHLQEFRKTAKVMCANSGDL
jgi:hypothetical protein